jgi:hypothetical protein
MPSDMFVGDGSIIRDAFVRSSRHAYLSGRVSSQWEKADVIGLDSVITAHGREHTVEREKYCWQWQRRWSEIWRENWLHGPKEGALKCQRYLF